MTADESPLLEAVNLFKRFHTRDGRTVRAVDGISFQVFAGRTLSLVGESGCGKSTTGRMLVRLIEPSSGAILFRGKEIQNLRGRELRKLRNDIQIVFQDPFGALDPRMTVRDIIGEPLAIHGVPSAERQQQVRRLLDVVGLAQAYGDRYPHEFSGGQRQRIGIARALSLRPSFIVCDEPVSALDVSIQAQIVNLLQDLQAEFNLAYLFISHDLSIIRHVSDVVAVMYLGTIVEIAPKRMLYAQPAHPYTKALLASIPRPNLETRAARPAISGDVASPLDVPKGCRFHTRCPIAQAVCRETEPFLHKIGEGRSVACHFPDLAPS